MKKIFSILVGCFIVGSLVLNSAQALPTLLHNVKGYSIKDGELEDFDSILFEDGVIIATGTHEELANKSSFSIALDGKGKTLLPGLIDAHGHILGLGLNLMRVDLRGIDSEEETVNKVKKYAQGSDARWILGRGWNQVLWLNKEFPTKDDRIPCCVIEQNGNL